MIRTRTRVNRCLLFLTAATLIGCASTSGDRSSASESELTEGFTHDMITAAELNRLDQGLSLMDLVEHARPWFLHPRGSTATVSVDGAPPAELAVLRAMAVSGVKEIRLLRSAITSPSLQRDGSAAVGDVILIVTGARSR